MTQLALSPRGTHPYHATRIITLSAKLARTLAVLKRAGSRGLTTMDLIREASCAHPAADVWHLNRRGWRISCEFERTSESGARVFRWKLQGPA
jgi:hypothetical protein